METRDIYLYGVPLTIYFKVDGKYYPATREQPEEYPEIDICAITASDSEVDLTNILGAYEDQIYEIIMEDYE